jgi:dihydroxyacetone kinase-like protein
LFVLTPLKNGKVGVISGGGSGHEPMHGGFVGYGMLDSGLVPAMCLHRRLRPMEAATRARQRGAGVLHIVKNYTGDVMIRMAAELCQAAGIEVEAVIIDDDVGGKTACIPPEDAV